MKRASFLLCLIVLSLSGYSQSHDWGHHEPLTSKGAIPKDFTEAYANKYERQRNQIDQDQRRRRRKTEDDFYRKSEYFINDFLISGNVLFGDTITEYCQRILDKLLEEDASLRRDLRVYVVKSPVVNASATASGIIFVNLGLIAEVENEAQLASVLAHEIVHYQEKHVVNQYVEAEMMKKRFDIFSTHHEDDVLTDLSQYSRELETEADREGFSRFYNRSGYSQVEAYLVLDILQYSYLPFDEIPFDLSFIEAEAFKIPSSYILDEVATITAEEDYDDSQSTHPNIKKRKSEIKALIKSDQGEKYVISKDWFEHCQRLARYENTTLYLQRRNYPEAIYNAFLLSNKYGTDRFQELAVSKALANASVYRNKSTLDNITADDDDIEGESQQIYHILQSFDKEDLNTLAVAYSYEKMKKHPGDEAFERIFRHSLRQLTFENKLEKEDFLTSLPDSTGTVELIDSLTASLESRSSKIKNIQRKKVEEKQTLSEEEYYLSAFVPYMQDSVFTSDLERYSQAASESGSDIAESATDNDDKYAKNIALGIDRVLVTPPLYLKLDERDENGIKFQSSEEQQEKYRHELNKMADRIGLEMVLLDYKDLNASNGDEFNDLGFMLPWLRERMAHKNTRAMVSSFEHMAHLREKYNTDYLAYTGNLSMRNKEKNIGMKLFLGIMLYPTLPFVLADVVTPDHESLNFFFLFDLRNGDVLLAEYNSFSTADRPDYVRSIIYNHLIQIKDKPQSDETL